MFDSLFLVLISVFVPVIVYSGFKIFKCKDYKKFLVALSLVFLAVELIRFFCNAALYEKGVTPSSDMKLGFITVLCIISLFATFNNSKFAGGGLLKNMFILTSLAPIVLGLFDSNVYVNQLDVNAVCKTCYMVECGLVLTIALFYVFRDDSKFSTINLLWASLFILVFVGVNALTIWYWKIGTAFDVMWFMSWLTVVLTIPIVFGVYKLYYLIKDKRLDKQNLYNKVK